MFLCQRNRACFSVQPARASLLGQSASQGCSTLASQPEKLARIGEPEPLSPASQPEQLNPSWPARASTLAGQPEHVTLAGQPDHLTHPANQSHSTPADQPEHLTPASQPARDSQLQPARASTPAGQSDTLAPAGQPDYLACPPSQSSSPWLASWNIYPLQPARASFSSQPARAVLCIAQDYCGRLCHKPY